MDLRPANNQDLDAIRQIVFGVLIEYGLRPDCGRTDRDLDDIEASYIRPGGLFEVMEDEAGRIVGTIGVMPLGDGVCELRKMYLLPEARGRGLGRRLLERALAWATEAGFRSMELETAAVLKEAIGLYQRYGFEPIDRPAPPGRCDQVFGKALGTAEKEGIWH